MKRPIKASVGQFCTYGSVFTRITLTIVLISVGLATASVTAQDIKLPESPPCDYVDVSSGPANARKLDAKMVHDIRILLSQHLKKLPKPFSPHGPGGLVVSPERTIQIRDANDTDHAQILLLPGLIVYSGVYATEDKDVIAQFRKLLTPPNRPTNR